MNIRYSARIEKSMDVDSIAHAYSSGFSIPTTVSFSQVQRDEFKTTRLPHVLNIFARSTDVDEILPTISMLIAVCSAQLFKLDLGNP